MKRLLLGIVIGAFFMAAAFWGIPFTDFLAALGRLNPGGLLVFTALFGLQVVLQAWRQQVLLAELTPNLTFRSSLALIVVGSFSVQTLPVRLGEFVRPWMLHRDEGVPPGAGLGIIAIERAMDLVALLLTLAAVLLWVELPSRTLDLMGTKVDIVSWGWSTARMLIPSIALAVVFLAVVGPGIVATLRPFFGRIASRMGVRGPAERLFDFAAHFAESFRALRHPGRMVAALALSGLIWAEISLMYYALGHAFGLSEQVRFGEAAGVMTITALGSLLPAPPAMAGVQEAFGRGSLALFGVHGPDFDAVALGYAVVAHWWQYLLIAAGTLVVASWQGLRLRDVLAGTRATMPAEPPGTP